MDISIAGLELGEKIWRKKLGLNKNKKIWALNESPNSLGSKSALDISKHLKEGVRLRFFLIYVCIYSRFEISPNVLYDCRWRTLFLEKTI